MVRLFHCADIHLDSPFSLFSPSEAESRRTELRAAFTSALMFARDRKADIFVISGDLFDGEYVTRDTKELLSQAFSSFPECHFFIAPGNHDPLGVNSPYQTVSFPENVHIFGETRECVRLDALNADVYGFGYGSRSYLSSPVAGWQKKDDSRINILVCHGELNGSAEVGNFTKEEIGNSGFDYIALGHIHKPTGVLREKDTFYAYPGCIEGRGFDERGYKGALFGTLDKGVCDIKSYRFSKRRYESIDIDISGCSDKLNALSVIRNALRPYTDDTALRVRLTGELKNAFVIQSAEIGKGREYPYYIEIFDDTVLEPDFGELESSTTLRGVFYRMMREKMKGLDENGEEYRVCAQALRYGLCALDDRIFTDIPTGG